MSHRVYDIYQLFLARLVAIPMLDEERVFESTDEIADISEVPAAWLNMPTGDIIYSGSATSDAEAMTAHHTDSMELIIMDVTVQGLANLLEAVSDSIQVPDPLFKSCFLDGTTKEPQEIEGRSVSSISMTFTLMYDTLRTASGSSP